jgi:hypothetical protein
VSHPKPPQRQLQQQHWPKKPPVVMCPGCKLTMKLVKLDRIEVAANLADLTYVCERCETTTKRTVRRD